MSDNEFNPSDYEEMGGDNPFLGLDGWDEESLDPDPYEQIEKDVMGHLGIDSFDDVLIEGAAMNIENSRGNRFESLTEAIIYLFDAGILQFSGVVYDQNAFPIEVEGDTGRGKRKR